MSSARSTVSDNGNGYKQANRVDPSSTEPIFVPKLPKNSSDGIVVDSRLEGTQDHESIAQPPGSADRTHGTVQEIKKSKDGPSSSYSSEEPPPYSYPRPAGPTPPTAPQYPTLAATTGSKQAKPKGNGFQATAPASQSNDTRDQGAGRGGDSANTLAAVDVPSSNTKGFAGAQMGNGKSSEQEDRRPTLESFMANYPSLNVTSQLEVHPPFATGGLVDVHSGVCRKRKVFVKVLRSYEGWRAYPNTRASRKPHITTEMPKWAALKHQNVCAFFGYSTRFGPYPALVYTWCGGGTVFEYLRGRHLRVEKRIRLAQDVAEGLQHLHENDIVHGDLTLKNVLVDDSGIARLCDFGLAQLAEWQQPIEPTAASNYSSRDRYRAPELSSGHASVPTFESDIYSLGCIMLKFVEELNPFDGVRDVAKQKRKIPPVPPALRKNKTDVLLGMSSFFWNQLEACWEQPAMRPKTYKIVENLQTLSSSFPLTQIEIPPPYSASAPEPVDKTTLNYGSIPTQPPVEVAFSLGSTRDLLTGRPTPIPRPPPRTDAGLSSFGQPSNASLYTYGSREAVYHLSNASLHTQGSREAGYEVAERQLDATGGSMMTKDGLPESRDPRVAPPPSFARDRQDVQSRQTPPFESLNPSPGYGTRYPGPTKPPFAVPAKKVSSATMGGGGGGANSGGVGGGNTPTVGGGWDKANEPVDNTTLNYGPSRSIPTQPLVEVASSLDSTDDLSEGRTTPTRELQPRTQGNVGLSYPPQLSDASYVSRAAGDRPYNASLYTQESRTSSWSVKSIIKPLAGAARWRYNE